MSNQNTFLATLNPERTHNLRVMSTPTWPVPYYQRAFRHPTNMDGFAGDLLTIEEPVSDCNAMFAKELLKMEGNGYVVEAIEQHYNLNTYITGFADSTQFCNAYVDDLLDCLDVAHQ